MKICTVVHWRLSVLCVHILCSCSISIICHVHVHIHVHILSLLIFYLRFFHNHILLTKVSLHLIFIYFSSIYLFKLWLRNYSMSSLFDICLRHHSLTRILSKLGWRRNVMLISDQFLILLIIIWKSIRSDYIFIFNLFFAWLSI